VPAQAPTAAAVEPGRPYTDDPARLAPIEPSIVWTTGDTPLVSDPVYVRVVGDPQVLFLSAHATTGMCFYLRDEPQAGATGYGEDPACGSAAGQTYFAFW